ADQPLRTQPHEAATGAAGTRIDLRPPWRAAGRQPAGIPPGNGAGADRGSGCDAGAAARTGADRPRRRTAPARADPRRAPLPAGAAEVRPVGTGCRAHRHQPAPPAGRGHHPVPDTAVPYGELYAHVVGYVGRIDADDQARLDSRRYAGSTHVGKTGLERFYEDLLHGSAGFEQLETNAAGRPLRVLSRTPPQVGNHLYLSI